MQLVLRVGGIYMADDGLIGAVTSHGLNVQFAVQGNLEGENMLAGLLAYLVAVYYSTPDSSDILPIIIPHFRIPYYLPNSFAFSRFS